MVKLFISVSVKLAIIPLFCSALPAQTDADRERRLAELERKMRQVDPTFAPAVGASIDIRLSDLERKMDALLEAGNSKPANSPSAIAEQPAPGASLNQSPLQQVSVAGDYQRSGEAETRLPVSGYME